MISLRWGALFLLFFLLSCLSSLAQPTITTLAGNGSPGFSGDGGQATSAQLWQPQAVAVDSGGNVYIADTFNHRIRKVTPDGVIRTIAGNGTAGFSGDGGPASSASLNSPSDVAVDRVGNLYVADTSNQRIRKVSLHGVISTVAGCWGPWFGGDGGPATSANLYGPQGVAVDGVGDVFIADGGNGRIRKVTPDGLINTVAGDGDISFSGDGGPATGAGLSPTRVAVDTRGNLYLTDDHRVRKVTPDGLINTVAGGLSALVGDGGPATSAQLKMPRGIAVDQEGNLYIADAFDSRIRKVNPDGIISTIAGNGTSGFSGDGGLPQLAVIAGASGVALDAADNLFIADTGNNRIRRISNVSAPIPNPVITSSPTLHTGYVGSSYYSTFTGSSGMPPYAWAVIEGTMPSGLSFASTNSGGVLSGTPATTGTYTFTVQLTDSILGVAVKDVTVTIEPALPQTCPPILRPGAVRAIVTQVPSRQFPFLFSPIGTDFSNASTRLLESVTFVPGGITAEFGVSADPSRLLPQARGDFSFAADTARLCEPLSFYGDPLEWGMIPGSLIPLSRLGDLLVLTLHVAPDAVPGARDMIIKAVNGTQVTISNALVIDPQTFEIQPNGGATLVTTGTPESTLTGQARVSAGPTAPTGLAVFGFRQGGILVGEATVPASPATRSARIYAEIGRSVNTGVAVANPASEPIHVSFYFTDSSGVDGSSGTFPIPGNGQIAVFLNQSPFNAPSPFLGSLTLSSPLPIAVIALRGFTNERSEFLMTTLPVADLTAALPSLAAEVPTLFPHLADGGGWRTQIVLVNVGDVAVSGTVEFSDPSGGALRLETEGQDSSTISYSIPPRSSRRFATPGAGDTTRTGCARIKPAAGNAVPSALLILSFRDAGVTVTEAGVPATAQTKALRMYVESAGTPGQEGSVRTGVAVANSSSDQILLNFELLRLDGTVAAGGEFSMAPTSQTAVFLDQIPGSASVPTPFQGILRISTPSQAVSMLGLRCRINERGDFLITTLPVVPESRGTDSQVITFPHFAAGGGYTTQFVLFGPAGELSFGRLDMFSHEGRSLDVPLR